MLLAIDDRTGVRTPFLNTGVMVKAILAELLLQGRIEFDTRKKLVTLRDAGPTGDSVLDSVIEQVQEAGKPVTTAHLIMKHSENTKILDNIVKGLCEAKILKVEKKRTLGIFSYKVYPEAMPDVENQIRRRMAKLLFGLSIQHDIRTTLLIAFAKKSGLMKSNFNVDRLQRHQERIQKIVTGRMLQARLSRKQQLKVQPAIDLANAS